VTTQNKPASLRIVAACEQDVSLIFQFLGDLAEYEQLTKYCVTSEEQIRQAFFSPQPAAYAVLAYEGSNAVGIAVFFYTYSTFAGCRGLYLEDLYVKPEVRGKGVGRELLGYLARLGSAQGCNRMEWAVLDWNEQAIGFYQNIGARPIEGWTVYRLGKEGLDELVSDQKNDTHR